MKDIKQSLETMDKWLNEVSENNDHEIKRTKNLKTLLFTLQVVGRDLPTIKPICKDLAVIISELNESTSVLVNEGRTELRQAFKNIKSYVEEKEKIEKEDA